MNISDREFSELSAKARFAYGALLEILDITAGADFIDDSLGYKSHGIAVAALKKIHMSQEDRLEEFRQSINTPEKAKAFLERIGVKFEEDTNG